MLEYDSARYEGMQLHIHKTQGMKSCPCASGASDRFPGLYAVQTFLRHPSLQMHLGKFSCSRMGNDVVVHFRHLCGSIAFCKHKLSKSLIAIGIIHIVGLHHFESTM